MKLRHVFPMLTLVSSLLALAPHPTHCRTRGSISTRGRRMSPYPVPVGATPDTEERDGHLPRERLLCHGRFGVQCQYKRHIRQACRGQLQYRQGHGSHRPYHIQPARARCAHVGTSTIHYHDGYLSATIENRPLVEVLHELGATHPGRKLVQARTCGSAHLSRSHTSDVPRTAPSSALHGW